MSKRTIDTTNLENNLKRRKGRDRDALFATIPYIDYDSFQHLAQYLFQDPYPIDYIRLGKLENLFINNLNFTGDAIDQYFNPLWAKLYKRDYLTINDLNAFIPPVLGGVDLLTPNLNMLDDISQNPHNNNTYWKRVYEYQIRPIVRTYQLNENRWRNTLFFNDTILIGLYNEQTIHYYDIKDRISKFIDVSNDSDIRSIASINDELFVFTVTYIANYSDMYSIMTYNLQRKLWTQELILNVPLNLTFVDNPLIVKYQTFIALVVINSDDDSSYVIIIDSDTGKLIYTLGPHANEITNISFNNNIKRPLLGVTTFDTTDYDIWDLNTGTLLYHDNTIEYNVENLWIKFNRDGSQFVTYDEHGGLILWDTFTFQRIYTFQNLPKPLAPIYDVSFSDDNRRLVIGTYYTASIIDLNTKQIDRILIKPVINPIDDITRYEDYVEYMEATLVQYLRDGHILVKYKDAIIEWDPAPKMLISCSICSISSAIQRCSDCKLKLCDTCSKE